MDQFSNFINEISLESKRLKDQNVIYRIVGLFVYKFKRKVNELNVVNLFNIKINKRFVLLY